MKTALVPDVVRGFERSYSRLVDDIAEYLFAFANWFASGSPTEIGVKAAVSIGLLALLLFGLGGAKAMGDEKRGGSLPLWAFIVVVFAVGAVVALVLMSSDIPKA